MERERIDAAIHTQLDRRLRLLRDVDRSGGEDRWSHLHSHGHRFPTVKSAIGDGYLRQTAPFRYVLTEDGRKYLADIDAAKLRIA